MHKFYQALGAAGLAAALFAMPAHAAILENNGTYTVESPPVTPETSTALYMDKSDKPTTSGTAFYGSQVGLPSFGITTNLPVDFASGVAQVTAPGNDIFNTLTITVQNSGGSDFKFHDILFSTQFAAFEKVGTGKDATFIADFEIFVNGVSQFSFNASDGLVDNALTNWLLFQDSGATITTVTLQSDTGFKAIKFLEISGLVNRGDGPNDVPLPAAVFLFGSVLVGGAGLSAIRRRRKVS